MEMEMEMGRYEVTPFGIFLETWDGNRGVKRECILPRDRFVEAYEKWIKNAPTERENSMEEEKTYEQGANDAWELARKIALPVNDGGFTGIELTHIFEYGTAVEVLQYYNFEQVFEMYEAYKKKKNEINVGDEVRRKGLAYPKLIVTRIYRDSGTFDALGYDGHACVDMTLDMWEKTGKHVELDFIKEE